MWRVFQILFEEPVPLPVMAALFAVLAVLRLSSPRCAFVVVNSVTNVDVGTAKMPHPGARCALLLTALILVMIVHCRSSSPSSGTTAAAVEKGPCLDLSWILLSVINLVLLYLALKQRSASSLWRSVLGYEAACSLDSLSFDVWLHGNISGGLAEGSMLVVPPGRVALLVAADQKRCEEGGMAEG
ncbi:hypothetical protein V6N13_068976 [Hibiscus sabdariffa]